MTIVKNSKINREYLTAQGVIYFINHGRAITAVQLLMGNRSNNIKYFQAGKSYTMLGSKPERGIIYRFSNELFEKIQLSQIQYEVMISIYEIENEKLYDHLTPNWRSSPNLVIQEGLCMGVYIPDLSKHLVKNYSEVEQLLENGVRNFNLLNNFWGQFTWQSTLIIQVELKQIIENNHRVSIIQFVDLAGSENALMSTRKGKEMWYNRKYIRNLQQVIKNLSEKNSDVIPYRASKLTRILQNALGGNCKTYMICAISPALMNSKETLATLRYGQLARKIVNKVSIYRFQADQLIDTQFEALILLKSDIEDLLQQLIQKNLMSVRLLEQINRDLNTEDQ